MSNERTKLAIRKLKELKDVAESKHHELIEDAIKRFTDGSYVSLRLVDGIEKVLGDSYVMDRIKYEDIFTIYDAIILAAWEDKPQESS